MDPGAKESRFGVRRWEPEKAASAVNCGPRQSPFEYTSTPLSIQLTAHDDKSAAWPPGRLRLDPGRIR